MEALTLHLVRRPTLFHWPSAIRDERGASLPRIPRTSPHAPTCRVSIRRGTDSRSPDRSGVSSQRGGDGLLARKLLSIGTQSIDIVDLNPTVTELARLFPALPSKNNGALDSTRVRILYQDAFRYFTESTDATTSSLRTCRIQTTPPYPGSTAESFHDGSGPTHRRQCIRDPSHDPLLRDPNVLVHSTHAQRHRIQLGHSLPHVSCVHRRLGICGGIAPAHGSQ